MSLLEKATSGKIQKAAPSETHEARTSLFARAMASSSREAMASDDRREKIDIPPFKLDGLSDLKIRCAALPSTHDSIFAAWSLVSTQLHLSTLALFLPQGDFLALAARNGFPASSGDSIPVSIAPSSKKPCDLLVKDSRALLEPILGVPLVMPLRATSMWADSGLYGLWVYSDINLEVSSEALRLELAAFLARSADSLPALKMEYAIPNPTPALLASVRKYSFVAFFRFDIAGLFDEGEAFKGAELHAIRSAYLAACRKILVPGGAAFAYGESSVACALGSSSNVDADLALFQFSKTLKRILPLFAGKALPEGRAMSLGSSQANAAAELSRFLYE
jgi:hypothetical protein